MRRLQKRSWMMQIKQERCRQQDAIGMTREEAMRGGKNAPASGLHDGAALRCQRVRQSLASCCPTLELSSMDFDGIWIHTRPSPLFSRRTAPVEVLTGFIM